jgi:hypothetical protein
MSSAGCDDFCRYLIYFDSWDVDEEIDTIEQRAERLTDIALSEMVDRYIFWQYHP